MLVNLFSNFVNWFKVWLVFFCFLTSFSFFLKFHQISFFNFVHLLKFSSNLFCNFFCHFFKNLSSIQFILINAGNYMRFAKMQKPVCTTRMFPFVFALKTDRFQFVANGMRTIRILCSAGSQSHPHIWFGNSLRAVCKPISVLVYMRLHN